MRPTIEQHINLLQLSDLLKLEQKVQLCQIADGLNPLLSRLLIKTKQDRKQFGLYIDIKFTPQNAIKANAILNKFSRYDISIHRIRGQDTALPTWLYYLDINIEERWQDRKSVCLSFKTATHADTSDDTDHQKLQYFLPGAPVLNETVYRLPKTNPLSNAEKNEVGLLIIKIEAEAIRDAYNDTSWGLFGKPCPAGINEMLTRLGEASTNSSRLNLLAHHRLSMLSPFRGSRTTAFYNAVASSADPITLKHRLHPPCDPPIIHAKLTETDFNHKVAMKLRLLSLLSQTGCLNAVNARMFDKTQQHILLLCLQCIKTMTIESNKFNIRKAIPEYAFTDLTHYSDYEQAELFEAFIHTELWPAQGEKKQSALNVLANLNCFIKYIRTTKYTLRAQDIIAALRIDYRLLRPNTDIFNLLLDMFIDSRSFTLTEYHLHKSKLAKGIAPTLLTAFRTLLPPLRGISIDIFGDGTIAFNQPDRLGRGSSKTAHQVTAFTADGREIELIRYKWKEDTLHPQGQDPRQIAEMQLLLKGQYPKQIDEMQLLQEMLGSHYATKAASTIEKPHRYYIARGITLTQVATKPLTLPEILTMSYQLADQIRRMNIVKKLFVRDVNSHNLLLIKTPEGNPVWKLIDFGYQMPYQHDCCSYHVIAPNELLARLLFELETLQSNERVPESSSDVQIFYLPYFLRDLSTKPNFKITVEILELFSDFNVDVHEIGRAQIPNCLQSVFDDMLKVTSKSSISPQLYLFLTNRYFNDNESLIQEIKDEICGRGNATSPFDRPQLTTEMVLSHIIRRCHQYFKQIVEQIPGGKIDLWDVRRPQVPWSVDLYALARVIEQQLAKLPDAEKKNPVATILNYLIRQMLATHSTRRPRHEKVLTTLIQIHTLQTEVTPVAEAHNETREKLKEYYKKYYIDKGDGNERPTTVFLKITKPHLFASDNENSSLVTETYDNNQIR